MAGADYSGADLFVDALEQYGVTHLFGNPGTTELPVMEAIGASDLDYVLGLHEDVAVGMAAGYAKTRTYHAAADPSINPLGVVNLHIAPGLAHGIGNLHAAWFAGAPILVTAGNNSLDHRHEEPILSGDLLAMVDQYTKWSAEILDVDTTPTMVRRAVKTALTPPTGPVFLSLPLDVMMAETDEEPERLGGIPDAGRGDPAQIERAGELLVDAEEPVFVVGDHVARAGPDAVEAAVSLAEAAGARVHGEILNAEVAFPSGHPQWAGGLPTDVDRLRELTGDDVVCLLGVSTHTPLTRYEGEMVDPETTLIQVSSDAWQVGKNHPADAAVVGDPGHVMAEMADIVAEGVSEAERERRLDRVATVKERVDERAAAVGTGGDPDDPRASKAELARGICAAADPADTYIVSEGVTSTGPLLARWERGHADYMSNKGGGLGYGLPAAIGAAVAEREAGSGRTVLGFVGDGSYLYYPHSIYSAAREDLDMAVVIPDNRNYRILKDNTLALFGGEEEDYAFVGMDFEPPVDIPTNVESHGGTGRLVEHPDDIEDAVSEALSESGTTVLDVLIHD